MSRLSFLVVTVLAFIDCMLIVTSRIVSLVVLVISVAFNCFNVHYTLYVQSSLRATITQ